MSEPTYATTPGPELSKAREALGAGVGQVAAQLGVSRTTVWRLERNPAVSLLMARAYHDALARIAEAH